MKTEYIPGKNSVLEALKANVEIKEIYIEKRRHEVLDGEILSLVRAKNIPLIPKERDELDDLCEVRNHQGIIALIKDFHYTPLDVVLGRLAKEGREGFFIILDHLEDPHNLGAIIRSALCGGVDGVIIPENRSAQVTSTVMKVSAGSVFHLPIIKVTNISSTIEDLKKSEYWIYGASGEGKSNLFKTKLTGKIALVLGNEGSGLSPNVKKHCDDLVSIPQKGPLGSLNVSVAAGVMIYHVFRCREEV